MPKGAYTPSPFAEAAPEPAKKSAAETGTGRQWKPVRRYPRIGEPSPPESKTSAEEERAVRVAREVIRDLQPLRSQSQKIYDRVKFALPSWDGPRGKAADLTNSVGALEFALSDTMRKIRSKR